MFSMTMQRTWLNAARLNILTSKQQTILIWKRNPTRTATIRSPLLCLQQTPCLSQGHFYPLAAPHYIQANRMVLKGVAFCPWRNSIGFSSSPKFWVSFLFRREWLRERNRFPNGHILFIRQTIFYDRKKVSCERHLISRTIYLFKQIWLPARREKRTHNLPREIRKHLAFGSN